MYSLYHFKQEMKFVFYYCTISLLITYTVVGPLQPNVAAVETSYIVPTCVRNTHRQVKEKPTNCCPKKPKACNRS